jgi:serpin B
MHESVDAASPASTLDAANLAFALKLFSVLDQTSTGENLFLSPFSVSLALAMVYNGARGSTLQALARATGYTSLPPAALNHAMVGLLGALRARDKAVALQIADSLWYRQGIGVSPAFMATLKASYGAPATALDFNSPTAPATINAWVSRQTHGLIPSIVHTIQPEEVLFLINALYFKAPWALQFQVASTQPGPFTLQNGQQKTLPLMAHAGAYAYAATPSYQAISLPYASGQFSMVIVLPTTSSSLAQFQRGLTAASWQQLVGTLSPHYGRIVLPRFTVDYSASLNQALSALGMGIAFDPNRADLSGMFTSIRGYVSRVQHRAIMEVNEQGTTAAAVTSIGVGAMAVPVLTFTMLVNRPFFCAIRDNVSGTLLFMGSIVDPK